jgi:AP-4 complex subunit beta-1
VLACIKIFINFTKDNEFLYSQVLKRLRDPLVTLMTSSEISGNNELCYTILSHIYVIIQKGGRPLFSEIYKKFFVKFEEPLYVKNLKLEILVQIANENNYQDILNEMDEYVNDVNGNFSMNTIRKIGSLGLRVDSAIYHIVGLLKNLLSRNIDYIVSESLCVLQTLLRKYPAIIEEFIKYLEPSIMALNNDAKGLSAILWIIGEFGDRLETSPYILENLLDHFASDIQPPNIIYSLLTAGTKLFFKTPGEMQPILGRIYEMILKNYHDVDLRDRCYYYYNLLSKDIELAKYIICGENSTVDNFYNELDDEYLDQIYSQFNTLSIIYQKPEEKFVKQMIEDPENFQFKKKDEQLDELYEEEQLHITNGGGYIKSEADLIVSLSYNT